MNMQKNVRKPIFPEKLLNFSLSFSAKTLRKDVSLLFNACGCWIVYGFLFLILIPDFEKLCRDVFGREEAFPLGMRMLLTVQNNTGAIIFTVGLICAASLLLIHRSYARFQEAGYPESHWIYRLETSKWAGHAVWITLLTPMFLAMVAIGQASWELYKVIGLGF